DLAEILDDGDAFDHEFRVVRADGAVRWVAGRGHLVRDPATGRPLQMFGLNFDVTDRKQAEAALRERAALAALGSDVAVALGRSRDLRGALQSCAKAVVRNLGAAAARVCTLSRADNVLELQAVVGPVEGPDPGG